MVDGSVGLILHAEVGLGNPVHAEIDAEDAVLDGRADRHMLAAERFAQVERPALEADRPVAGHLAYRVGRAVLPRRQRLGERPVARAVAAPPPPHAPPPVRALVAVDLTPRVETPLTRDQVLERTPLDHLGLQRAVEPL